MPADAPELLPGTVLRDPGWLAERVGDIGRIWRGADRRITATLWWYSASSVLLDQPVTTLLTRGRAADPHPDRLLVSHRRSGYLATARSERLLEPGPAVLGAALGDALGPTIDAMAQIGGAGRRPLWAIAADSLANRLLLAGPAAAADLAEQVAAGAAGLLPRPRFVRAGQRLYVRRASCCLIYLLPEEGKCTSCPRQHPQVRARRLLVHATAG